MAKENHAPSSGPPCDPEPNRRYRRKSHRTSSCSATRKCRRFVLTVASALALFGIGTVSVFQFHLLFGNRTAATKPATTTTTAILEATGNDRDSTAHHAIHHNRNHNPAKQQRQAVEYQQRETDDDPNNNHDEEDPPYDCLSRECVERTARSMARPFRAKPYMTWCYNDDSRNSKDDKDDNNFNAIDPTATGRDDPSSPGDKDPKDHTTGGGGGGLQLVKVPKSASSTVTGIVLRIRHRRSCTRPIRWQHGTAVELGYHSQRQHGRRDDATTSTSSSRTSPSPSASSPPPSFLIAPIRLPHARALSSVYFHFVSFHTKRTERNDAAAAAAAPDAAATTDNTATAAARDRFVLSKLDDVEPNYILQYTSLEAIPADMTTATKLRKAMIEASEAETEAEALHSQQKQKNTTSTAVVKTASSFDRYYLTTLRRLVRNVVQGYDLFLVVERMDESVVVFSYLTGIPLEDLIAFDSKRAGNWYLVGGGGGNNSNSNNSKNPKCVALQKPIATPAVTAYFDDRGATTTSTTSTRTTATDATSQKKLKSWRYRHYGDYLLHAAANASLQRTIEDVVGSDRVRNGVERLQQLRRRLSHRCANETHFPCSLDGEPQLHLSQTSCYLRDFGCGFPCIDRVLELDHADGQGRERTRTTNISLLETIDA